MDPEACDVWTSEMIGYFGLHDVRRLAAYVDCGKHLTPPAGRDDDTSKDSLLAGYFDAVS